jgi:hypothetical protein
MTDMNSLNFDDKNPAKTLATLAKIDEVEAQKFLSELPLTDYIAIINAIQNKDLKRLSDVVGKHKLAEDEYHEALDYKVKQELGKIQQKVAQTAATHQVTPSTPVGTTGTNTSSNIQTPQVGGKVVDADSKTGTLAIQDPLTKKTVIKNTNNPKDYPEIEALLKNAGM